MFNKSVFLVSSILLFLCIMTFSDNIPPSPYPPGGLSPSNVPQFVNWGFDDNYGFQGIEFILNYFKDKKNPKGQNNNPLTYDSTPARVTFYITSDYLEDDYMHIYNMIVTEGHEVGNHTTEHKNYGDKEASGDYPPLFYNTSQWTTEMNNTIDALVTKLGPVGLKKEDILGFRAPFLSYNNDCFSALSSTSMTYDCTLHGGSYHTNPASYNWPYTLDSGSPGQTDVNAHPGVWEVPTHYCVTLAGEIVTGLDFNMIDRTDWGAMGMSKSQYLGTLKNTFDRRYDGGRAPFTFGAHSHYYGYYEWWPDSCPNIDVNERQEVLTEFFDYVLSKPDVRVVSTADILKWMKNPVGLDQTPISNNSNTSVKRLSIASLKLNTINIFIPCDGFYSCCLYSTDGRLLETIAHGFYPYGSYTMHISQKKLIPGSYVIKLAGTKESSILKFVAL